MTISKLRIIARRRWPLIVLGTVLCLGAAVAVSLARREADRVVPDSAVPDSWVATGIVAVDRSQLFDQNADPGLVVLEAQEAGLYERVDEVLSLPGGVAALEESTQIYPGPIPGLAVAVPISEEDGSAGSGNANSGDGDSQPTEALLIQVSNLDAATAEAQAEATAVALADIASAADQAEYDAFVLTIGEGIAEVEAEIIAFDQANPRIALLQQPVEPGDAFLIFQRAGLQAQLDALGGAIAERAALVRSAPGFQKLPAQAPQLLSQIETETTAESLREIALEWVLPAITGLLLAVGLVYVLERVFPRVDTRDDIQDELGIEVLAEVPRVKNPKLEEHTLDDLHGADAEMYRSLRSSLEFIANAKQTNGSANWHTNGNGRKSEVILVVSPTPAEGKTRSAAYLGLTYAEAGHDVVLFGCDFRRPRIHDYFGLERDPGLGSLTTDGSVEVSKAMRTTGRDRPLSRLFH